MQRVLCYVKKCSRIVLIYEKTHNIFSEIGKTALICMAFIWLLKVIFSCFSDFSIYDLEVDENEVKEVESSFDLGLK